MRRAAGREVGSITTFMIGGVIALFFMIGLVVDGGGKMQAHQRAAAVAGEAARAGAQAITPDVLIDGSPPQVDAARAVAAAQAHLSAADMAGEVQVAGASVTVSTTSSYSPVFLAGSWPVTGQATVEIVRDP